MEVKNSGTSLTPNRLTPNKYHATNIVCLGYLKVKKLNCKIYKGFIVVYLLFT